MKKLLTALTILAAFTAKAQSDLGVYFSPFTSINITEAIVDTTFDPDCEFNEGCLSYGYNKLLNFTTCYYNSGPNDLILGDPSVSPIHYWDSCHHHYHVTDFIIYELLNCIDTVATFKAGFVIIDNFQLEGNTPTNDYHEFNQGVTVGWGDCYGFGTACQYINITGVPDGIYRLRNYLNASWLNQGLNIIPDIAEVIVHIQGLSLTTLPSFPTGAAPTNLQLLGNTLTWQGDPPFNVYRQWKKNPNQIMAPMFIGTTSDNKWDIECVSGKTFQYFTTSIGCEESDPSNVVEKKFKGCKKTAVE